MDSKSVIVYSLNVVVTIAAFALVFFGKITWEAATVVVMALLVPSAGHVAVQNAMKAVEDKQAKK